MADKALEKAVAFLKSVLGEDATIVTSLAQASATCAKELTNIKIWAVVPITPNTLRELQAVLAEGRQNLAVALVSVASPVSRLEVLNAIEVVGTYVGAAQMPCKELVKEAAQFLDGASVLQLADEDLVKDDKKWIPFRFDPRRESEGLSAFVVDGGHRVREEIECFVARENLLTLMTSKHLPKKREIEGEGGAAGGSTTELAKTITILYSSDTGHGVECAKALGRFCRAGGFANSAIKVLTMDAFDVGSLANEALVVFCVSTAGKGEFPGNGKIMWKALSDRSEDLQGKLGGMNYTVFGLGDSHYWGKGSEDSKINFCKPARDLDGLLEKLGAQRFLPIGFGDDQDADQYHTGFAEWKNSLLARLGINLGGDDDKADEDVKKPVEIVKCESAYLRCSLKSSLDDTTTGKVPFVDARVSKFHGAYLQDDKSLREERQKLGIEPAFAFMIRARMPGGFCTSEQWLSISAMCQQYGGGVIHLTKSQTWQMHGVEKRNVKSVVREMNRAGMSSFAACGDVCRNVTCTVEPRVCSRDLMADILGYAQEISDHCLPRTAAYHEVFIMKDHEMQEKCKPSSTRLMEEEPLYGKTYLPRKCKVAIAIPPCNDVHVFSNDCGLIAIIEQDKLQGFNIAVGGSLGYIEDDDDGTEVQPKMAELIGFCEPRDVKYVVESILATQRDYGDRRIRGRARTRYTVQDYGPQGFCELVEKRFGKKLLPPKPYDLEKRSADSVGWTQMEDNTWHCGIAVPCGQVKNELRNVIDKIASELKDVGTFRLTCNQGLLISDIPDSKKEELHRILEDPKLSCISSNDDLDLGGFSSDSEVDWDSATIEHAQEAKYAGA